MSNSTPRTANRLSYQNTRPIFLPIADRVINEGEVLNIRPLVTDPDALTFGLSSNAPEGMSIQPMTGLITWRPRSGDLRLPTQGVGHRRPHPSASVTNRFTVPVREVNPRRGFFNTNLTVTAYRPLPSKQSPSTELAGAGDHV
jgi:hypothetical protein